MMVIKSDSFGNARSRSCDGYKSAFIDNYWRWFELHRVADNDGQYRLNLIVAQNYSRNTNCGRYHNNTAHYPVYSATSPTSGGLFNFPVATHAMIGVVNVDGRFVTGNANLRVNHFRIRSNKQQMDAGDVSDTNGYHFGFEERAGQHNFVSAAEATQEGNRGRGLNLNAERVPAVATQKTEPEESEEPKLEIAVYPNETEGDVTVAFVHLPGRRRSLPVAREPGGQADDRRYLHATAGPHIKAAKFKSSRPSTRVVCAPRANGFFYDCKPYFTQVAREHFLVLHV